MRQLGNDAARLLCSLEIELRIAREQALSPFIDRVKMLRAANIKCSFIISRAVYLN